MRLKPHKYHAVKTVVDGITFASKREAKRYQELKLMERAGEIKDLIRQYPFKLLVGGVLVGKYICDFIYWDCQKQRTIWEDCKGPRPAIYKLKKKLMKALYGIDILET